jgi:hypothetical protein
MGQVELANVKNNIQAARKNNVYPDQAKYVKKIPFLV